MCKTFEKKQCDCIRGVCFSFSDKKDKTVFASDANNEFGKEITEHATIKAGSRIK
jgi:hypothetical protein